MPSFQVASLIEALIKKTTGLIGLLTALVFTLAVLVFAWGIVKMISAAGNTEKIKQAKGIIWWGILGMFVLASIGAVILFLQEEIGIQDWTVIPVPQFR